MNQTLLASSEGVKQRLSAPSLGQIRYTGFAGSVLLVLGSMAPGSPFTSKPLGSWFIGIQGTPFVFDQVPSYVAQIILYIGLLAVLVSWFQIVRAVIAKSASMRFLLVTSLWWFLPLLVAGPLFSRDVYSYAAIGEMVSRHISPYLYGPNILGATPYLNTVDPFWGNAPAPYGPLFLWIAGASAVLSGHDAFLTMIILRALAIIVVIAIAAISMKVAKVAGYDSKLALVLVGMNPIFVYHLASSAHNDALMMLGLAFGIWALKKNHPYIATFAITLGASVKVPVIVAVAAIAFMTTPDRRLVTKVVPALKHGAVMVATLVAMTTVSGVGWGWVHNLSTPGTVVSPAVPTTIVAAWLSRIASLVGLPSSFSLLLSIFRGLGLLLAALITLYLIYNIKSLGFEKVVGLSLLAIVLFGPVIQPWYITWGLMVLAMKPSVRSASSIVFVSILGMVLGLPDGPSIVAWTAYSIAALVGLVYVAGRLKIDSAVELMLFIGRARRIDLVIARSFESL
ncbi:MAG: polyprenol phosphomannose-dependent alpha 1,6 mannosyltransferase MptB [Actinomycetota bacterium]|nr:polyprenol phosphomannose-dependent alpha 1,6 mannosyltransferase MptB [Actinomycetota bacterium]